MPALTGRREPTDPGSCTCFNLRRAARALSRRYDEALRDSGLRANQFSILAMAGQVGPQPLGRLADRLGMERTTLSRNLRPLERDGLMEVRPGEDRRARQVAITALGRRRLASAMPLWQAVQREVVGELGEAQWRRLLEGLAAV